MISVLLLMWAATLCVTAETQLHPIQTDDLKSIVDSVKRDVDHHLTRTSSVPRINKSEPKTSAVIEDVDNFLNVVQESMHRHLVRNLGQPVDASSRSNDQLEQVSNAKDSKSSLQVHELRVGSMKGVPGVNFPDYTDIPVTSFRCSDKTNLPGFYADLDTGCQVFHVCYPERRESFLCPMGTIFNQAHQVCDYWYNSNCSLAPHYYTVNAKTSQDFNTDTMEFSSTTKTMISTVPDSTKKSDSPAKRRTKASVASFLSQFMPVKAKVVIYPETESQRSKIVASASIGERKKTGPYLKSRFKRDISRLPQSTDNVKLATGDQAEQFKILQFRFSEVLDRTVEEIRKNETLSNLFPTIDSIAKFLKRITFIEEPLEPLHLEPGSKLHEYDMKVTKNFEDLGEVGKMYLIFVASEWNDVQEKLKLRQKEASTPVPLTQLNPRFIVNPAVTEEMDRLQIKEEAKKFVKRGANASLPIEISEDRIRRCTESEMMLNWTLKRLFNISRKFGPCTYLE